MCLSDVYKNAKPVAIVLKVNMNRWKKAERLSNLIMKFGDGNISKDTADLAAYRYFSKKTLWDMIKPDHMSLSQIANNYVIGRTL